MKKLFIFVIMVIFVLSIVYSSGNNLTNTTEFNLTRNSSLTNETSLNITNITEFNLTENIFNETENIITSETKEKISKIDVVGVDKPFSSIKFDVSEIGAKIESRIYEELEKKNKTRVIVILKEDWTFEEKLDKKERFKLIKEKIKEKQNKVLSNLMEDFELKNRYKTINAFSGIVTKVGLNKLEHSPFVERVYLDRKAYTSLSESVPLIEADDVWNLGYTGTGTVCITDTGVDYTHADLGNPSCSISQTINGNIESYLLESPHPYSNNYDNTWQITKPGYTSIAVHFSKIEVEANYDFVYLYNAQGNFVQVFTGNYYDIWSVSIPGDTIYVRLVTDSSVTSWGFAINQVLNGTVDSTWSNCGQVIGGYDFVNNDNDPMDDNGHGTHVSGIVASQNPTYKGVAPGANIVANKVLDSSGSGWFSNVAAGVDWCIDNKDKYNIHTISMSLGDGGEYNNPSTQCDPYTVAIAINTAFDQGIFVSVASGNEAHLNGISYPACASNATSVGAVYDANVGSQNWQPTCRDGTTYADKIVCFTNRDEILDLLAPGCKITSLSLGGGTATYCGTSMSAPMVAGVASLMLNANNTLTPSQIRNVLKNTGKGIYDSKTGLTFPRINASAAVNSVAPPVEFISITLYGYPIDFGSLDQNTFDSPALGNVNNSYIIRVDNTTTVNVDTYIKGDDYTTNSYILGIGNMSWNTLNNVATSVNMTNNYQDKVAENVAPETDINMYYWMDIPLQRAGDYTSAIYIKAVEIGNLP